MSLDRPVSDSSQSREGRSVLLEIERLIGTQFRVKLRDVSDKGEVALGTVNLPIRDIGRYQTIGELGTGGVGRVYRCRDLDLGREIALKVIREEHHGNRVVVERFIEEAQVGGQLQHPGIVPVYELGLREDRTPYFTMKLVKGKTLSEGLADRKNPEDSLRRFLAIFEELCQAVAFAHSRGVVHRDLKPANILLGPYGEVMVVDWGFAKVLSRGGIEDERKAVRQQVERIRTIRTADVGSQSIAGSVMGTPAYMPPEQARGKVDEVDRRTDVFALGSILTQILTGSPAYVGESSHEVLRLASQGRLEDAHARLSACTADPKLVKIARGCLEIEPKDRPRDALVVANAIAAFQLSVDMRAHEARLRTVKAKAEATHASRMRKLAIGFAAAICLIVAVAVGVFVQIGHTEAARRSALEAQIFGATDDALRLSREAARTGDLKSWIQAVEASRRATVLADDRTIPDAHRARCREVQATVEAGAETAREARDRATADAKLLSTLSRIRDGVADELGFAAVDAAYRKAFLDYGIDFDALAPAELALAIRRTGLAGELAPAIDAWTSARRGSTPEQSARWQKLEEVARSVDPDDWRNDLRDAWLKGDGARLKALAGSSRPEGLQPESLVLLGNALAVTGDTDAAVKVFRDAQRVHAGDFWINHYLAYWLLECREWDEAIRFSLVALALRPESPVSWLHLGLARGGRGDTEGEIAAYRRAIDLEPGFARAWYDLAVTLKEKGDRAEALDCLGRAIQAQPDYALAHSALGAWQAEIGNTSDARASLGAAVRSGAGCAAVLRLSRLLRERGDDADLREAQAALEQALAKDHGNADLHYEMGFVLSQRGQNDGALGALRKTCDLRPDHGGSVRALVTVLFRMGQLDEEMRKWQAEVDRDPAAWAPRYRLAVALIERGGRQEAIAQLERVAELLPKLNWPLKELAFAQKDLDSRKAAETYRRAVELDPSDALAWNDLGATLHRLGEVDEAIHAYRRAIQLDPLDTTSRFNLAFITAEQRKTGEALDAYEGLLRLSPTHAQALAEYVTTCFQRSTEGDVDRGVAATRRAIEISPSDETLHMLFGAALGYRYGREEGEALYHRVVGNVPPARESRFLSSLGTALLQRGETADAVSALKQAVDLAPEDPTSLELLVTAHLTSGAVDEAVAFARDRLRRAPRLPAARQQLSRALEWKADPDLAAEAWREAQELLSRASGSTTGVGLNSGSVPAWHPSQAIGPPDVKEVRADDGHAWNAARADAGREWLELTYEPPMRGHMLRIHEVVTAGGVVQVVAFGPGGEQKVVWEGEDPTKDPGVFELNFEAPPFKICRIRIYVDTGRAPGWEEIDAVELVGPDGRAWASGAAASSVYGETDIHDIQAELVSALNRRGTPADREEMVRICLQMVRAMPASPQAHMDLGVARGRSDDPDDTDAQYRTDCPQASDLLRAAFYQGVAVGRTERKMYREATAAGFRAVELAPNLRGPRARIGLSLGFLFDFGGAESTWKEKMPIRNPMLDAEFYVGLAVARGQVGDDEGALNAWEAVIVNAPRDPSHTLHLVSLAEARLRLHDPDRAIEALKEAGRSAPTSADVVRRLADALFEKGDLASAIREYRGALALSRGDGWTNYHLGIALAETGEFEAGLNAVRRAPLLLQMRGHDEVIRWEREIERMASLRPRASGILSGGARPATGDEAIDFARLCWYSGYAEVAVLYYRRAFEMNPALLDDRGGANRYAAARAAAKVGKNDLAIEWLKADLASWTALAEKDPLAFVAANRTDHLRYDHPDGWSHDWAFSGLRTQAAFKEVFAAADALSRRIKAALTTGGGVEEVR